MTLEAGYALAFLTGLLGAGHCLGMCSGLTCGLAVHRRWGGVAPLATYHVARIAVYVGLGTVGAFLGRTLVQTGALGKVQGQIMMLAGLVIMVLGLGIAGLLPWATPSGCRTGCPPALPPAATTAGWRDRLAPLIGGLANGLMPCGLVYSVAARATATADPFEAAILMLSLGLGTLPAMASATALGGWLGRLTRGPGGAGRWPAGALVVLLGAWTLYQGGVFYRVMSGLAD